MTNAFGKVDIHHPERLIAGQLVTVEFDFEVGSRGMSERGILRIGLPSVAWGRPEVPQYYFWSAFARGKDRLYCVHEARDFSGATFTPSRSTTAGATRTKKE